MTVFGVDFSLTSTGLAMWDGERWDRATIKTTPRDSSHGAFLDRVDDISARILTWTDLHDGDVVCMEGPALHAKSSQLDRMFGGWWMVYRAITEHHGEPFVIPPSTLKQIATGKANAGKDAMVIQAVRRVPAALVENNDEVDAVWLAVAGAHIADLNPLPLPKEHLKSLHLLIQNRTKETP